MDNNNDHHQGVGGDFQQDANITSAAVPQERLLQQPELGRMASQHSDIGTQNLQCDASHPYSWRGRIACGAGVEFY